MTGIAKSPVVPVCDGEGMAKNVANAYRGTAASARKGAGVRAGPRLISCRKRVRKHLLPFPFKSLK